MDRRTILKLLAAAALTACGQHATDTKRMRVVIAGAGIVGASIAYHLAKSGAAVTVIDAEGPATHASRGTFAWINATWAKQPRHYHALNQESTAYWRDLQSALNLPVRWGGSLEWFSEPERSDLLTAQIAEQVDWDEPARIVNGSEIAELEPSLEIDADVRAVYSPNDGAVDPVLATLALLDTAASLGATVSYPSVLSGTRRSGGRLNAVETSTGTIAADRLVLATGAAVDPPREFAGVDIPQRTTPGIIALTKPMPRILNRIVAAPGVHMHQRDDGRIVLGEQDGAPDNEAHSMRLEGRPNDFPSELIAIQHGERMLDAAARYLPRISGAEIDSAFIGWRPLPVDGHPVLGASPAVPDVYLAIMHSGVTLAPVVGKLVAREIAEGQSIERLSQYRPDRDFEVIQRY